jgi:uncharacterized SAM-binding protein YcdF (DUF218 family)
MAFLYSVLLKLLEPFSLALVCLVSAALLQRRKAARRSLFGLAVAVLVVCGNQRVTDSLVRPLERRHLPPEPVPSADAIVILSSGVLPRFPPRPTVEVADAGDRVLYGAELYRRGLAPVVICTGNVATGQVTPRPHAEDMADLLVMVGVPRIAIVTETRSENTRDHAVNLCPFFGERRIGRVLLVTSAMHMPRSVATFRRLCPAVEVIPAPTDFRAPDRPEAPWYREAADQLPSAGNLSHFADATHEYLGMAYYRLRGWM